MERSIALLTDKNNQEQLSIFDFLDDAATPTEDEHDKQRENNDAWTKNIVRKSFPRELIIDFDSFINYVNHDAIQLTVKQEHISRKYLPSINAQLSIKAENISKNAEQSYYPYIHFFFYIALASGLVQVVSPTSSHTHLVITDRWSDYKQLTEPEKYLFLLETFWVDVNWSTILGQENNPVFLIIEKVFTDIIKKERLQLKGTVLQILTKDWNYFFAYLEWFGFWINELDHEEMDKANRKNRFHVKSLFLTPFGAKMLSILLNKRHPLVWNISNRCEYGEINPIPGSKLPKEIAYLFDDNKMFKIDHSSEDFHMAFHDLFPPTLVRKTLAREKRDFIPGVYTFTIAQQNKSSRHRGNLDANHTMADLHHMIGELFQFDDDHLYSFFMDGKKWSKNSIVAPLDNSGAPIATEVKIGATGLYVGQKIMYLYDYGAEWIFTITVEEIEADNDNP